MVVTYKNASIPQTRLVYTLHKGVNPDGNQYERTPKLGRMVKFGHIVLLILQIIWF